MPKQNVRKKKRGEVFIKQALKAVYYSFNEKMVVGLLLLTYFYFLKHPFSNLLTLLLTIFDGGAVMNPAVQTADLGFLGGLFKRTELSGR